MASEQFHTIKPEFLKNITVNEIVTGKRTEPEKLDYSVPVPTTNQGLPHRTKDGWLVVEMGNVDSGAVDVTADLNYRGRIGGC